MEDLVEHRYGRDDMRLVTASFRTHRFVPHAHRLCSEILARYTRRGIAPAPSAPVHTAPLAPIQRVRRHLAEDLRRTPSLDELAQVAGLPRFQLLRAFRRETGVTPHGYLLQLRLRCAQQHLTAGHTVARAATESGFYDQAHLHRHFRRTFAATPGRFARNDVQDRRRSRA